MRKPVAAAIAAAAIAVALTSAVAATAAPRTSHGDRPSPSASATAANVSVADAQQIALSAVPGATVIQVESDDEHDHPVWKVTLLTSDGRVVLTVDANTGQLLAQQPTGPNGDTTSPDTATPEDNPGHDVADDHHADRHTGDDRDVDHRNGADPGPGHH